MGSGAQRGRIWALRHGESTANVEGLIVSAPGPRALTEVGLTPRGREQAREAARQGLAHGLGPETVVLTSDFARALQTAEQFAAGIGADAPRREQRLRERSFGRYDEGPADAYEQIWAIDRRRGDQQREVESVRSVAGRALEVLRAAEELAATAPVVLVAHGDVLQIVLALGAGADPHDHREVPHLGNGELRRIGDARAAAEE